MFLTVILTSSLIEMMWVPWLKPHKITIFSLTGATIIYKKSKLNAFCTKNACTKLKQPLTGNILCRSAVAYQGTVKSLTFYRILYPCISCSCIRYECSSVILLSASRCGSSLFHSWKWGSYAVGSLFILFSNNHGGRIMQPFLCHAETRVRGLRHWPTRWYSLSGHTV